MKVSRTWLSQYFADALPEGAALADIFTAHSFEVEEQEGDLIDLKVLPDRAGYALSHRGVAYELAAALGVSLKDDPLAKDIPDFPKTDKLSVSIETPEKCSRYMGALITGVTVQESPAWLAAALRSVGQRSINNIVDATNYVMLNIGQPLHAFDTDMLQQTDGALRIAVRSAKEGEEITTLSKDAYTLPAGTLLIADGISGTPLGIAGVKGGKAAEVTENTKNVLLEAAHFDGVSVRKTAQALRLYTDASLRFQNRPSPELAAYGMRDVIDLIRSIAGGTLLGVVDEYPNPPKVGSVSVPLSRVNGMLGTAHNASVIADVFGRLLLPHELQGDVFVVAPPFWRTDLCIPEDLIEEVARIRGYDEITETPLPECLQRADQARFRGVERMKDQLVAEGFVEVSTQSFAKKGDIVLSNPLDVARPALRTTLEENLSEALAKAKHYAPRILAPGAKPKLFEVGAVFPKEGEFTELRMTERVPEWGESVGISDNLSIAKLEDYGKEYEPMRYTLGAFVPFSAYPFIARDIAFWVSGSVEPKALAVLIGQAAGFLAVRVDRFDQFEKEGRTSYAFRIIFESMDRTLTDEEVNGHMEQVATKLTEKGYEVR